MTLSNLASRGTIKGTIYRGGGGGVTDYNALSGKPQINDVTIEGNHSGNYYSLMDTDDIDIIKITDIQRGNNYGITLFGTNYGIINMDFAQNESGLVPGYSSADAGKILSTNGWIDAPNGTVNFSTTEQKTGQKWIDGKDIYFITYTISSISGNPSDWVTLATKNDIDMFIDYSAIFYNANSTISFGSPYITISYNHGNGTVRYFIDQMGGGVTGNLTATIYYTKQ